MSEPRATYRIQLVPNAGFAHVAELADYLRALGISHVYLSPVLQASPGSTHGYDIVDPARVSEDLGGTGAFDAMCASLGRADLGQLVDVVPNHMAIGANNPYWWDVLENGPSSLYAEMFDVDWAAPEERLRDKLLLPILGDHAGRVIEAGEVQVARAGGEFTARYYEHVVPVAPRTLSDLLARAAARCGSPDLAYLAEGYAALPLPTAVDTDSVERRHRNKGVLRAQLERLCVERSEVAAAVDAEVTALNANPDALDAFLAQQNFRLAFWRTAARDLGYRRFFDINSLVALRVEDERVFQRTHALVLRWLAGGVVDGLRIDHVDGLRDPLAYLSRLRAAAPGAWLVVEKILEEGERLPATWPVGGTTGYDFLNLAGGLFVHPGGEAPLTELYARFTGEPADYEALARAKKHQVLRDLFGSDLNRLTALFLQICEERRRFRDYSRHEMHEVLRETLACFPVYRTYVDPQSGTPSPEDERLIRAAVAAAKEARPDIDAVLFDLLGDILQGHAKGPRESELLGRFQQASGPVMAKGVEDTAFYAFNRFVALNEVGGNPGRFGRTADEFHAENAEQVRRAGYGLLATSTHDTKRAEDVRARLYVLSELPGAWADFVARVDTLGAKHRDGELPDANARYLFFQTLVGAWPLDAARASAYMLKAAREAKLRTSWTTPDGAYEAALQAFVEGTLGDAAFVAAVEAFVGSVRDGGRVNSLALTLLKLTTPGVPDVYQGTELWDLSLVDPDNRRPVDFAARRRLLRDAEAAGPADVLARADEGLPKLWLIQRTLALRARRAEAFAPTASYKPLAVAGRAAEHVVAFARASKVAVIVPRWSVLRGPDWGDTRVTLPRARWRDALQAAGGRAGPSLAIDAAGAVTAAALFATFPVALLEREES